jgi:hypothetical protein
MPTTDTIGRKVKDFGIGTYDSSVQPEYGTEGDFETMGESLPVKRDLRDDGDEIIGDAYAPTSNMDRVGVAELPGDLGRPPKQRKKPEDSIIDSVAQSELPNDRNNPPARSDYYDRTKIGDTMLPGPSNNDQSLDRFLGSFGNWWSGWTENDMAQPTSFPGVDSPPEETDKYTSVPMGVAGQKLGNYAMERQATNLELVGTLTTDFLKKNGKKGLTRRHVMAFLQEGGYHQYLASDVIRCLQQRHNVHVADVLDQFPISTKKIASTNKKTYAIRNLVDIGSAMASINTTNRVAFEALKKCGNNIVEDVVELVRGLEDD